MTPARRHRVPNATSLLILLSVIIGMIAVVSIFYAVTLGFRVTSLTEDTKELAQSNDRLLTQTNLNRVETATVVCEATERVKKDLRAVLKGFNVDRRQLPRHRDGSYAFDALRGSCRAYAKRLVRPPPPSKKSSSNRGPK